MSDKGTSLKGGNNVTIDAASNSEHTDSYHNEKKSGIFGNGGASFTIGRQTTTDTNRTDSTSHTASTVGTNDGNTVITAGNHYQQTASKVFAKNQTTDDVHDLNYGTLVINAKSATIQNSSAVTETHSNHSQKTTGLTVKVSNSLIDQAQGIQDIAKAGEDASSDRMKVMAGVAGFNKVRTLEKGVEGAIGSLEKNGLSKDGLAGVGNTRIQATLGSQSNTNTHDSLTGHNEASSIDVNNAVFNIQGNGKGSNLTFIASDLNVAGDRYNNVEGDVVEKAATGTGYERSSNKSSGFGVGVYASTQSGAGITANANMAKGSGKGDYTTNANSHVTVGGTTYQNIGGDLVLDGAVVKGDHMTGHIDGAILARSRQDTATYDGKQVNAGFSADVAFNGAPQSVSVNAGGSKINADYAAVKEQTGIAMNSSDVVVGKASRFDGAYFTTATPEANKTVFKEGVTVTNIENHMNYKGDSINVGLGAGLNPTTQKISPPGISGIGYGKDGDSQTSTTYGAVTGMAGKSDVTTANVSSLNETLENSFDKTAVEAQLGAQVQVSQAFDTERRTYRLEMAKKEQELRDKAKEAEKRGDMTAHDDLIAKADKQQHDMVLFDSITGAIYGPNSNGATGYVARAVAPEVSYQIGQYFKENTALNGLDNGGRQGIGSPAHILAHGILAAAVSAATGNDPTTGALSAMGAEAAAPMVSKFLFKTDDSSQLTAEQKATVSSITSLAGLGVGATTGDVGSAVSAGETAKNAVDDNYYYPNLKGIGNADPAQVRRIYNLQKSYFDANCKTAGGNCNTVIQNMLNFVNDPTVRSKYGDLRNQTIAKLNANPKLVITYVDSLVYKFNANDRSVLNRYIMPIVEAAGGGFGIAGATSGTVYACAQTVGVGCYAAAILGSAGVASSYDHVKTGLNNLGKPLSQQRPTDTVQNLQKLGLSPQAASALQMAVDVMGTGGAGYAIGAKAAVGSKPIYTVKFINNDFNSVAGRTLIFHDNVGGHTVLKHVARSDAQLITRLRSEPNIPSASTFDDLFTAERAIADAIKINQNNVNNWVAGSQPRYPLPITDVGYDVGRVIRRGTTRPTPATKVQVVLQRDASMPYGFKVLTAYPEP